MKQAFIFALIPLLALGVMSCADGEGLVGPPQTFSMGSAAAVAEIQQGFYWLPPMAKHPDYDGVFDGSLSPSVVICELAQAGDACVEGVEPHATFTTDGKGPDRVRVDERDEHYLVNWRTRTTHAEAGKLYRVHVLVGDVLLGYATVFVAANGRAAHAVPDGHIGVVNGAALPIKFRIEGGGVARIEVAPAEATILEESTQQFTATLFDLHDAVVTGPEVAWSSSDAAIATIDASSGLATGVSEGDVTIKASVQGVSGTAELTVDAVIEPVDDQPFSVLVLSNNSPENTHVVNNLSALMPDVTFEARRVRTSAETPTVAELNAYRTVILFENVTFNNAKLVGDRVAEYVQNGGNLIIGSFYWDQRSDNPENDRAGWGDLEDLDPFFATGEKEAGQLDPESIVSHPLTEGVNSLTAEWGGGVAAREHTSVVASWANGVPLIGHLTHANGQRVVGVSVFPAHGTTQAPLEGDFWQIWENAVRWTAAGSRIPPPAGD